METKKFISNLGQNAQITKFLLSQNLMQFAILDVAVQEDGSASFMTVEDFHRIEEFKNLDTGGQFALELFGMFNNSKNAIATLLKHIESKKPLTEESFKNQAKNTPKNYTEEHKKMRSFTEFMGSLSPEDLETLKDLAKDHFSGLGLDQTGFQFFFLNGTDGVNLTEGQYVRIKDTVFGYAFITKVLQASPGGYVSLLDGKGLMTLSAESAKNMQILLSDEVPAERFAELEEAYNKAKISGEENRETYLQKGAERAGKLAEAQKLADEKKAREELKAKKSATEKAKIEALTLNSMDEVKKFVDTLNKKSANLIPAHKKELAELVKTARATLTAKIKESKPAKPAKPAGKETTSTKKRKTETSTAEKATPETKEKAPKKETAEPIAEKQN